MTAKQIVRARVAALLILAVTLILAVAAVVLIPKIISNTSVAYTEASFAPEAREYCPGDLLVFHYKIEKLHPGPVEITSSWCRIDNVCSLTHSQVNRAVVFNPGEPVIATLSITVPYASRMLPGTDWVFVRSIQNVGDDKYDMFTVPFRIKDVCP